MSLAQLNDSNPSNYEEKSALTKTKLTLLEGISLIIGTNIGAGVLSLAFGTRNAGWPVLLFWVIITGSLTTVMMLYVAETTLRTRKSLQLSGLAKKYVGKIGSWVMFISVAINALGAMTAYASGSGEVLSELFHIPQFIGSLIFFIPAAGVIWLGLKIAGVSEKVITVGMLFMVLILVIASIIGPKLKGEFIFYTDFKYAIPVFSLVIFSFLAQYIVPELARGYEGENIRNLPKAIIFGMMITGGLLTIVPLAALGVTGPDKITEVATIAWSDALGQWSFFIANGFALFAMLTSFWGIGQSFMTNIVDQFKFPSEWDRKYRLISVGVVTITPFVIAYSGLVGFADALSVAGSFAGVIMSILPVVMLNRARKLNEQEPEWSCGRLAHPIIQTLTIILFVGAALYSLLGLFNILPKGW